MPAELGPQLVAEPVLRGGLGGQCRVQLTGRHLHAVLAALVGAAQGVVDAGLDALQQRAQRRDQQGTRVHATSSIRACSAHRRSNAPSAARRCSAVTATAGPQPCANSVCSGRSMTVVPVKRTVAAGNSSEKT